MFYSIRIKLIKLNQLDMQHNYCLKDIFPNKIHILGNICLIVGNKFPPWINVVRLIALIDFIFDTSFFEVHVIKICKCSKYSFFIVLRKYITLKNKQIICLLTCQEILKQHNRIS